MSLLLKHSPVSLSRTDLTNDEIKTMIVNAINKKPEKHEFNTVVDNISNRQMVEIENNIC
jgi:hypothetical protein